MVLTEVGAKPQAALVPNDRAASLARLGTYQLQQFHQVSLEIETQYVIPP